MYRKAAEQGYAEAQNELGVMHAIGDGVPKDDVQAAKWYRLAAEQGLPKAQFNLGGMYAIGDGVPKDDVQAYAWLNIADAQGYQRAEKVKELVAESMTRKRIARAQELAREYWEKHVLPFRN